MESELTEEDISELERSSKVGAMFEIPEAKVVLMLCREVRRLQAQVRAAREKGER